VKGIFQINYRYHLIRLAARTFHVSRKADCNYQEATIDVVDRGWVSHCTPPFRAIGQQYFAREAHHDLARETVVFCLLMLTMIPPLLNGASAIVTLIH
jgi:hypothetical protein